MIPGPSMRRLVVALAVCALGMSGCTSSGSPGSGSAAASEEPGPSESASGSTGAESDGSASAPYLPVPGDVTLTAPGTQLQIGDAATVAVELPKAEKARTRVGVLQVRVQRVERAGWGAFEGWVVSQQTRSNTPYFVRVGVINVGRTDLGGVTVPLYVVDGTNTLLRPARFASTFRPCAGAVLPDRFRPEAWTPACLVYLAPDRGEVTAVSFRPTEEFDPIEWRGEIERYAPAGRSGGRGGGGRGDGGGRSGSGGAGS